MDNRKALLALIKQNSEKINGIVASNSDAKSLHENEKVVNTAINFCFCEDSGCNYVKDFRYKIDDLSLFRLFVLQNDVLDKIYDIKKLDFNFFIKDCKNMVRDYKYGERYKEYFPGSKFEYKHLVEKRKEFMFDVKGREPIKPLTKAESDRVTYKQKYDALKEVTETAYKIYLRHVNSKDVNLVSYEKFETNINYGDMNKLIKGKDNMEYEDNTYSPDDAIEREKDENDIDEITNDTSKELSKDNDYYYDEGGQGYLNF